MHAENVRVQAWKILCSHKNSNLCVLTFNKTRTLKGGQNISNLSHGCCTKLNVQLIVIAMAMICLKVNNELIKTIIFSSSPSINFSW